MVELENWKIFTIENLTKIFTKQTGFDYTTYIKPTLTREYKTGYIPFIQNKDFNGKFINYETDYYIPSNIATDFPRILLNEKCLLVSISGSVGNVAVFNNLKTAFIGGAIAIGKFKDKELLDWCMYYLMSREGQSKLLGNVKAGSHQNLILDDLRKIEIPIPPKEEQKAIAKALSDTDELISSLEKLISKKEAIKQGTMQQLLTGKKRLSGFSGEWEEKKLGDIFEITAGGDLKKDLYFEGKDEKYQYPIYANSIFEKGLYGYSTFSNIEKESVTVTARGTLGVAFYRTKPYVAIGRLLILQPKLKVNCLFCTESINLTLDFANESTSVPQLTAPQISKYEIKLPKTIEEQNAIAQILSDMDNEIETLKSQLSKTKAIKGGMMSELLTGKTRLLAGEKNEYP